MSKFTDNRDPDRDIEIDVTDLTTEFRLLPSVLHHYSSAKASSEYDFELAKANYEEVRSFVYLELRKSGEKITEKNLDALIDTELTVKTARRAMLEAKRDLETLKGYVDGIRAKKDMLIQLGADARKE